MVERIEKVRGHDPWEVAATKETKEEKKREQQHPGQEQQKDSFEETSDFIQLLAKDPAKFSRETLAANQIKGFTFRGVSTHREKSLLEVDISLSNGTLIKGAQVALTRQEGMRFLSRRPGEEIVADQLVKGTFLTVAVPQRHPAAPPAGTAAPTASVPEPAAALPRTRLSWFYYFGVVALLFAMVLLVYLFLH